MSDIAIIGAGPMGLACAYHLLKQGHRVEVFEADDRVGGMSAHFDFAGMSIERYYHFVCGSDQPLFDMLEELNIGHLMQWRDTKMGYYHEGTLHAWGDPVALLRFSGLGLISKLRYGLHMFYSTRRRHWQDLDGLEASQWIRRWIGDRAYAVLWQPLFEKKFYQYKDNLSAAWIWTRIKRVGNSRKNLFQERMGYIEGGSQALLEHLSARIASLGGKIHLSTPVQQVEIANGQLQGLQVGGQSRPFERVVSTMPLPFVPNCIPDLPTQYLQAYRQVRNIAVVCVLFKLRRAVTENFWLNVSDSKMDIPGIIEFSNLRPLPHHVVYVPYYMPQDHAKYAWSAEHFIAEAKSYIQRINPKLNAEDFIASHVSRYRYAQPVCPPNFLAQLPPMQTPVPGLLVADTSYYYPEDRSISESFRLARELAHLS
jgi:protoporphyrinogen oxidase